MNRHALILFLSFLSVVACSTKKPLLEIRGDKMYFKVMRDWSAAKADSVLAQYDLQLLSYDSLMRFGTLSRLENEGWRIHKTTGKYFEISKPIRDEYGFSWSDMIFENFVTKGHSPGSANQYTNTVFGYNEWKRQTVFELNDSITRFYLFDHADAEVVFLSGSFNNWSTISTRMIRSHEGWYADVKLKPGRHEYKFIIDGYWTRDLNNLRKIDDSVRDFNSVYFKANHTFTYTHPVAKKVVLAGSFNDWNESRTLLLKNGDSFALSVFLPDNDYQYRFIADGHWVSDPNNPNQVPNEHGETNSYLEIGEKFAVRFELPGFAHASRVILTGSFNGWNESAIVMQKEDSAWVSDIRLRKGFYAYKFIVDGKWTLAPSAQTIPSGVEGEMDNWLVIQPNFMFRLNGFEEAKNVAVTGNFTQWNPNGLKMAKQGHGWTLPFYFESGKITYKYIVDGKWITDPANPQIEENEYGTGNSVLWIGQ